MWDTSENDMIVVFEAVKYNLEDIPTNNIEIRKHKILESALCGEKLRQIQRQRYLETIMIDLGSQGFWVKRICEPGERL